MKIIIFLAVSLCFPRIILAETIVLKSGKSIQGKIVEKTKEYIKLDFNDVPITYFLDEIESIDGVKVVSPRGAQEALPDCSFSNDGLKSQLSDQWVPLDASSGTAADTTAAKPFIRDLPFSTAVITYQDTGELFNGEEIVYIDAKNKRVSRDTRVEGKYGCAVKKINKREICDGKTLCKIDLENGEAPTFAVKKGDAISNIFMEEMYLKYYKGQKSFLGKECKVYSSIPGEEFYFWNGILLKQVMANHPMGKNFNVTKEAVDIALNAPIPEDKFQPPEGVKVMTQEETMQDYKERLEKLKGVKKEDIKEMMDLMKKMGGKQ